MRFIDETRIHLKAGAGGHGCLSFRREANLPKGGPDGGDGGRGGHIYLIGDAALNTLIDFRYQQHYKAGRGTHGMGKNRTGATGKDLVLKVPLGTQLFDESHEVLIADITREGEPVRVATGGRGGFGNTHFKSSTNRAPRRTTPGEPGEEQWAWLELKVMADAGLVGLPNAGKSTLLSALSKARPKIADYPFTTLKPQLGIVKADTSSFVLADIPGLIEGAHQGAGLGHQFLRHIERCRVLVHLVDGGAESVAENYATIRLELEEFGHGLESKTEIPVLNKCDLLDSQERDSKLRELSRAAGQPALAISAATTEGTLALARRVVEVLRTPSVRTGLGDDKDDWSPLTSDGKG